MYTYLALPLMFTEGTCISRVIGGEEGMGGSEIGGGQPESG
jgi:hypothetical protein